MRTVIISNYSLLDNTHNFYKIYFGKHRIYDISRKGMLG